MIYRKEERRSEIREKMRDGAGSVEITHVCPKENLGEHGRMIAELTLKPGCGIGFHLHENETEIFLVTKGEARYNDNGNEVILNAGDSTVCLPGTGHAVHNNSDGVCCITAVIIKN